jgi:hypothetical protein
VNVAKIYIPQEHRSSLRFLVGSVMFNIQFVLYSVLWVIVLLLAVALSVRINNFIISLMYVYHSYV